MADIFSPDEVTELLKNKNIVFLGGSVVRGLYKDLCWLINSKSLIPYEVNNVCIQFPLKTYVLTTYSKIRNLF
jgi:hypothetical protein